MSYTQAAVLIPYLTVNGVPQLLLIERAAYDNDPHSGQVAFPGGRHEKTDIDLEQTALREAHEEVGLDREEVTVLREFVPVKTGTGFEITPFLARIDTDFIAKPDKKEVAAVFNMDINWLANASYTIREVYRHGQSWQIYEYEPYEGRVLWGASAIIARMAVDELKRLGFAG